MAETNKVVKISGDVSGLQQAFNLVTTDGQSFYRTLTKDAETYSNTLKDQSKYISDIITQEQKRIELEYRSISLAAEQRKLIDIEGVTDPTEKRRILGKAKEAAGIERQDYLTQKEAITEAKLMHMNNQERFRPGDIEEAQVVSEDRGGGRFRRAVGDVARAGMKGTGISAGVGLGVGAAMGVAGVIYEIARAGLELQESMYGLNAIMKDSSVSSTTWATDIGKTTAEVNQLMASFAVISGGTGDIRRNARAVAEASRAFNIDEGVLVGLGAAGLYGRETTGGFDTNQNMTMLLDIILGESQRAGVINANEGNFAFLSTQISNLQSLFELSTQQQLRPSMTTALNTLTAFQGLGARSGGGKDPRIMQDINAFNQGIVTPANDFTKAFLYSSLSEGGGYIETRKRMEQGILGEGNLDDIIRNLLDQYGSQDSAILALSTMFPNLGIQGSEEYIKAFTDKDRRKNFITEMGLTHTAAEAGVSPGARARAVTPGVSVIRAGITNVAGEMGALGLEGIQAAVDFAASTFGSSSKTVADANSELAVSMKGMATSIDGNTKEIKIANSFRNKSYRGPWKDINE